MARFIILGLLVLFPIFGHSSDWGWFWVPLVSLISLLLTGKAGSSLMLGVFSGLLFLNDGKLWNSYLNLFNDHFSALFTSSWKVGSLTFTILLGGFVALLDKAGGFEQIIQWISGRGKSKARTELAAAVTGLICFFDGLASNLMIGKLNLPSFDNQNIPRWRLAYIADTTGSCVACLAVFSTWIATQISLIDEGLKTNYLITTDSNAYILFLQSIPYNFYCIFALIVLFFSITRNWNFSSRKLESSNIKPTSTSKSSNNKHKQSALFVLLPIATLALTIIIGFYIDGNEQYFPVSTDTISNAFSKSDTMKILNIAAILSILITFLIIIRLGTSMTDAANALKDGCGSMLKPLMILLAAWLLGSVIKELGTTHVLSSVLNTLIQPKWFPLCVFLLCMLLSFITGTSWGTMGLLMPICLPIIVELAGHQEAHLHLWILQTIGAVFGGAVFGDHCSPFSDTTIVSSIACKISPTEHIITQLPFAILGATITIICAYIPTAFGLHWILCYAFGLIVLIIFSKIINTISVTNTQQNHKY